jgi:hypothetical protein
MRREQRRGHVGLSSVRATTLDDRLYTAAHSLRANNLAIFFSD